MSHVVACITSRCERIAYCYFTISTLNATVMYLCHVISWKWKKVTFNIAQDRKYFLGILRNVHFVSNLRISQIFLSKRNEPRKRVKFLIRWFIGYQPKAVQLYWNRENFFPLKFWQRKELSRNSAKKNVLTFIFSI